MYGNIEPPDIVDQEVARVVEMLHTQKVPPGTNEWALEVFEQTIRELRRKETR